MPTRDVAAQFLSAFGEKRIDDLAPLIDDDFAFTSPLQDIDDKEEYLATLRHLTMAFQRIVPHAILADDHHAGLFYEMHVGDAVVQLANRFTFRDGRIARSDLLYDSPRMMQALGIG